MEQMNKKFWSEHKAGKTDMAFSYLDRYIKLQTVIKPYIDQFTEIKKHLKVLEKNEKLAIP